MLDSLLCVPFFSTWMLRDLANVEWKSASKNRFANNIFALILSLSACHCVPRCRRHAHSFHINRNRMNRYFGDFLPMQMNESNLVKQIEREKKSIISFWLIFSARITLSMRKNVGASSSSLFSPSLSFAAA